MSTRSTNTSRTPRMLSILLALALVLAACGGSDESSASADEQPAEPTPEAMADDAMDDEAMADDAMDDEAMDDEAMADDMMLGAYGPGCVAVPADGEGSFAGMADDPAGTAASNNPVLSTLVTAVVEADLVDTLNSDGPFTIFAPTNDAFAAIDEDTLAAVLGDVDLLTSILTYHVIGGDSLLAEDLAGQTLATVEGGTLEFDAAGEGVNGASVICSNVPVANGTVHIIDQVLLPQVALDALSAMADEAMTDEAMDEEAMADDMMLGASGPGCVAVPADGEGSFAGMADDPAGTAASNNPVLSTLVTAVVEADLVDTLNSDGPFTIFAPTNDAFAAIDEDTLATVLGDVELLTSILTYHVVIGDSLGAEALIEAGSVATANGGDLEIEAAGDEFTVNGAQAICINVPTANATVHIIDTVLLPS